MSPRRFQKAPAYCSICGKDPHADGTFCPDARIPQNGWSPIGAAPEPSARLLALRGRPATYQVTFARVDIEAAARWPDGPDALRLEKINRAKARLAHIDAHPHRDPRPSRPWTGYTSAEVAAAARRVAELLKDDDSGVVRLPDSEDEPQVAHDETEVAAPTRRVVPTRLRVEVTPEVLDQCAAVLDAPVRKAEVAAFVAAAPRRSFESYKDQVLATNAATMRAQIATARARRAETPQEPVWAPDIAPPTIAETHFGTVAARPRPATAGRTEHGHDLYLARRARQNAKRKAVAESRKAVAS